MPHPYFRHGAFVIGLLPAYFGINALFRPEGTLRAVQFPVPEQAEPRKLSRTLMRIYGVRNIGVSYLMTLIWNSNDDRLLGFGLLTAVWMTVMDGLCAKWLIGGGEWHHWSFTPLIAVASAGLLGIFD